MRAPRPKMSISSLAAPAMRSTLLWTALHAFSIPLPFVTLCHPPPTPLLYPPAQRLSHIPLLSSPILFTPFLTFPPSLSLIFARTFTNIYKYMPVFFFFHSFHFSPLSLPFTLPCYNFLTSFLTWFLLDSLSYPRSISLDFWILRFSSNYSFANLMGLSHEKQLRSIKIFHLHKLLFTFTLQFSSLCKYKCSLLSLLSSLYTCSITLGLDRSIFC